MEPSRTDEPSCADAEPCIAARASFDLRWAESARVRVEDILATMQLAADSPTGRSIVLSLLPLEVSRRVEAGEPIVPAVEAARFPFLRTEILQELSRLAVEGGSGTAQGDSEGELPETVHGPSPSDADGQGEEPTATGDWSAPPRTYVGRYRLDHLLGRGGFGEVWTAFDPELHRQVAIKVMREDRRSHEDVDSLLKEGRRVASLKHPGIVPIYDVGRVEGTFFFVSELIPGGTLADRIKEGPIDVETAVRLGAAIAEALHHAHLRGMIHRDVKPKNILLGADGLPRLTDFGIAVTEDEQVEELPGTVGTLAYMPPEQIRGESHLADPRSDIYSLGVVLYQMLTGRLPFVAKTREQYREQILNREPRPPRTINEQIPLPLEQIVLKCLAKPVSSRFTTASDVAAELLQQLEKTGPARPAWSWWPLIVGVAAVIVVTASLLNAVIHPKTPDGSAAAGPQVAAATGGAATPEVRRDPAPVEAWVQRFGMPPTEIKWPGSRGRSMFSVDENFSKLMLTSERPLLIQCGTIPAQGTTTIQLRCEQTSRWDAGGLFWDYHLVDDGTKVFATIQTLGIMHFQSGPGQNSTQTYYLTRTRWVLDPDGGFLVDRGKRRVPIQVPTGASKVLEIDFADGKVTAVRSDGESFPDLVEEPRLVLPIAGAPSRSGMDKGIAWGPYVSHGSFHFSLP